MNIHHAILRSGDCIGMSVRKLSNVPWYQVYLEYDVGQASSFYDGPDEDRAFSMYEEVLLAFKGVREAEKFNRTIPSHKEIIRKNFTNERSKVDYHNMLNMKPKFLGVNDF